MQVSACPGIRQAGDRESQTLDLEQCGTQTTTISLEPPTVTLRRLPLRSALLEAGQPEAADRVGRLLAAVTIAANSRLPDQVSNLIPRRDAPLEAGTS